MGVDDSKSLVRITFDGLFIICRRGSDCWEVGVPNVGDHTFRATTKEITGGLDPEGVQTGLQFDRDIYITADTALSTDLFDTPVFNKRDDAGDPDDYRWILDMEGPEFHNGKKMKFRSGGGYKSKIFIYGGQLYTARKTIENYHRVKESNRRDDIPIYKVAVTAGINLDRAAGAGSRTIYVQNVDRALAPTVLPQKPGVRYELKFTHMPCSVGGESQTHYGHYYYVLKADDADTKYEVSVSSSFTPGAAPAAAPATAAAHEHGHEHGHEHVAEPDARGTQEATSGYCLLGNEPQVCNSVYLGYSDALPT